MPELPEVEIVCQHLAQAIIGETFQKVHSFRPDLRIPIPSNLAVALENQTIQAVQRRAKYLYITLSNHYKLIIHLGMSGSLQLHHAQSTIPLTQIPKHDHVWFMLQNGTQLRYHDPRRFGLITLLQESLEQHPLFANLGPEPLTHAFDVHYLHTSLQHRKISIKAAIMDNHLVVGVGNIYACESLFLSGIHPARTASSLTLEECASLVNHIKHVLEAAIQAGGSTIRDYKHTNGKSGKFQNCFKVYQREHAPCALCKTPIAQVKLAGRSSFFCPSCQGNARFNASH